MSKNEYKVFIDDNFHFMNEDERILHGVFLSADAAVVACRAIVDESLLELFKPGMSAAGLYDLYVGFGDDPFIVQSDLAEEKISFCASEYARTKAIEVAKAN